MLGYSRTRGPARLLLASMAALADEERVVHVVEAGSEEEIRSTLARDPWSGTHLNVESIEPWTLRLDARHP